MRELSDDFIMRYINYVGETEAPITFHRWAALVGIGALVGKSVYFQHGGFKVYPNLFVQLLGVAGSRKSTSIKAFIKLLKAAGYTDFAAEKTSKEKFIEWMADRNKVSVENDRDYSGQALWNLIDGDDIGGSTNVLIAADEFTDFFSTNMLDFMSFLGVMWDYDGNYEHSTRIGGTVKINNPCISILSGNTPTMLAHSVPPEALGQGFYSRTILIYGEETGIKIAFPNKPSEEDTNSLVAELKDIQTKYSGEILATPAALKASTEIYNRWVRPPDTRLDGYANRRFSQLLKLAMIHTMAAHEDMITVDAILKSNTILYRAEQEMSKALGEFGIARHAAANNLIIKMIDKADKPITMQELWQQLYQDFDKIGTLSDVMGGLLMAGKIQSHNGAFLPLKTTMAMGDVETKYVRWEYLTAAERRVVL